VNNCRRCSNLDRGAIGIFFESIFLELFADGHGKKAQQIFDRLRLAMARKAR
jgi:hypothetical protein